VPKAVARSGTAKVLFGPLRQFVPSSEGAVTPTPQLLERDFQRRVYELAKMLGYRVAHFRPAHTAKGWRTPMTGDAGWPDLVICGRGRLIFAELKAEKAKPREDQVAWLESLKAAGATAVLWHPSDWDDIVRLLTRPEERPIAS
jgi:hypothetical protein